MENNIKNQKSNQEALPIGYIYKTTNLINNKIYVGKRQKMIFDNYYLGSGKKLKSAIKHYGKSAFKCEVLQWCYSITELLVAEKYWIEELNSQNPNVGYNISSGGDGGDIFHTLSIEEQLKVREKLIGKTGAVKGKYRVYKIIKETDTTLVKFILPDELPTYLSMGWIHGLEPDLAKRQGEIRKGRKQSAEWIKKRCESYWNKPPEEIIKIKQKHSEATKKQMENTPKEVRVERAKKARQASLKKLQGYKATWIHKGKIKKMVGENTLDYWISLGWKRGLKLDDDTI